MSDRVNFIKSANWYVDKHQITIIQYQSDLFPKPTIIIADLHASAEKVIQMLINYIDLSSYIVITAGDMAGTGTRGSNELPLVSRFALGRLCLPEGCCASRDARSALMWMQEY